VGGFGVETLGDFAALGEEGLGVVEDGFGPDIDFVFVERAVVGETLAGEVAKGLEEDRTQGGLIFVFDHEEGFGGLEGLVAGGIPDFGEHEPRDFYGFEIEFEDHGL
jgi:hypothetical protein